MNKRQFIAIDPGTTQSAWLLYSVEHGRPFEMGIEDNDRVLAQIRKFRLPVVCEMIQAMGMPVGRTTFETVFWIGRFCEAAGDAGHDRVYRMDIKMHLCNNTRAKDNNIRQALIDRFPATGGGKTPQIGTKAQPGILYGFKSHLWAALGVAVTYSDRCNEASGAN